MNGVIGLVEGCCGILPDSPMVVSIHSTDCKSIKGEKNNGDETWF